MPKNPHPPRGGAPKKKPAPVEEDTSFIVFGDGKPKRGKKKEEDVVNNPGSASAQDGKGKGKSKDAGPAVEEPKKPDTRTLIGGASWTGKLPVNMLSEYCQKQKWGKPDYRMVSSYSIYIFHDLLRREA